MLFQSRDALPAVYSFLHSSTLGLFADEANRETLSGTPAISVAISALSMHLHEHVARPPRYSVRLAVEFRLSPPASGASHRTSKWFRGTSHNISAGGILFSPDEAASELAVDAPIEMRLLMPPELNPQAVARARCTGRIVRVERESINSSARIAATIERYRFERRASAAE